MLSKSDGFALLFAAVSTLLVGLYATGPTAEFLRSINMSGDYADIFTVMAVVATGAVCFFFGGEPLVIMTLGTISSFIALTLNQSMLVRYLSLAAVLFAIGAYGMVVSRNAVRVLISIELMLNAVNINMVAFARFIDPVFVQGQVFAIFILTVAAAEAAVGLAIVLAIYRNMSTVDMERFNLLKW